MAEQRVQRRLAAILVADVVGYSRLIEADEGDKSPYDRLWLKAVVRHNANYVGLGSSSGHGVIAAGTPLGLWRSDTIDLLMKSHRGERL